MGSPALRTIVIQLTSILFLWAAIVICVRYNSKTGIILVSQNKNGATLVIKKMKNKTTLLRFGKARVKSNKATGTIMARVKGWSKLEMPTINPAKMVTITCWWKFFNRQLFNSSTQANRIRAKAIGSGRLNLAPLLKWKSSAIPMVDSQTSQIDCLLRINFPIT